MNQLSVTVTSNTEKRSALQRASDAARAKARAESELVNAMYAARRSGASYAEIGRAIGRSGSTVRARLGES